MQELSQASMKIGQVMYGKKDGDATSTSSSNSSEDVKDAEYEEKDKKDDKKQ